jgi:hypothetical protein
MRFSTRAILTAVFALITFVAVAPAAHADGGSLDAFNQSFSLNTFSTNGKKLDTNLQLSPASLAFALFGGLGDLKTLTIVSGGTTYTFSNVSIKDWSLGWNNNINIDFKFKGETTTSNVPEPATTLLIGCGLLALAIVSSRKMLRA